MYEFEEWKPLNGNKKKYIVSNCGNIINLNWHNSGKSVLCKQTTDSSGYLQVGINRVMKSVHRLVWETFVGPITEGYDVHHKNGNKKDNRLENLCLIELHRHRKMHNPINIKEKSKPIIQFTKDGTFVAEYPSIMEAYRKTLIPFTNISACCNGSVKKRKNGHTYKVQSAGGFIWKYKEVA